MLMFAFCTGKLYITLVVPDLKDRKTLPANVSVSPPEKGTEVESAGLRQEECSMIFSFTESLGSLQI